MSEILTLAQHALQHSYSPYSRYKVGACIKTTDGKYFAGCNWENASYGLTVCAEATAIGNMIANGSKHIAEIAIVVTGSDLATPCGACRQRLEEFSQANTMIHLYNDSGHVKTFTLGELLPHAFTAKNIEVKL